MIRNYARQAPVTMALSLVMVIIWLATAAQAGSLANNAHSSLGEQLLLYPQQLTPVSIVGNMFMHFGAAHLVMNTIMLLLLGREIEMSLCDPWLYAAVFLVSGLGADAAIVHFHPNSVVAGVSGVLYSFMALLVGIAFRRRSDLRAPIILIAVNLAYSLLAPGISLWGHLGGLCAGVFLIPATIWPQRKVVQWIAVLTVGAAALGLTLLPA